eukprot:7001090-Ditylum_brightwellii.AAC.1
MCSSIPIPYSIPLLKGKSSIFTTIREESVRGSESKINYGRKAKKPDNIFVVETNMAGNKEDSDEVGAGVVNEWECNEMADNLAIPDITYHYNGPKGLKDGAWHKFNTMLKCIYETSGIDTNFFFG